MQIYIGPYVFNSTNDQKAIKKAIDQLPAVPIERLPNLYSKLKNLDLLQNAEDLKKRVQNIAAENKKEKESLLEQSFNLYRQFIKCNKDQISQRSMNDAAFAAIFTGADMLDLINDEAKKESIQLAIRKIQIISSYSDALDNISLNQTIDALNIPQRHFAVSSQPLGTTHVKDCVFLVMRNSKTYATFAAHIDWKTDVESIKGAIRQYMPQGEAFDNYIIGGHIPPGNIPNCYFVNVSKVSGLLLDLAEAGYILDSRWCVLQENTPVNIVYEPVKDCFIEGVPKKELSSYNACEILIYLDENSHSLLPYFTEFQEKETQHSLCVSPYVQKKLLKTLDQEGKFDKAKTLEIIWTELPQSLLIYRRCKSISQAFSMAIEEISLSVKKKSSSSFDSITQKDIMQILEGNERRFLYILPYSEEKNMHLVNDIFQNFKKKCL